MMILSNSNKRPPFSIAKSALGFLILSISMGCVTTNSKDTSVNSKKEEISKIKELEPLWSFQRKEGKFSFVVYSGGCTEKKHFKINTTKNKSSGATELEIYRITPDRCYAYLPEGKEIEFLDSDLGLKGEKIVTVLNPIEIPKSKK